MNKSNEIATMFALLAVSGKWEEAQKDMEEKMEAIKAKQRKRAIEAEERELKYRTQMLGALKNEIYS